MITCRCFRCALIVLFFIVDICLTIIGEAINAAYVANNSSLNSSIQASLEWRYVGAGFFGCFHNEYNFSNSLCDFWALLLARIALIVLAIVLVRLWPTTRRWTARIITYCSLTAMCFVVIKLLVYSEESTHLNNVGLWLLIGSNIVTMAATPIIGVSATTARASNGNNDAEPLLPSSAVDRDSGAADDAAADDAKETKSNKFTKATVKRIWRLLAFCAREWMWYSAGFGCLILFAIS